ncbi:MAG: flagellar hook-associated protein FlgK [Dorea sp.]|nr:flagellar hook-associated protein FlgK [Dorea sp.]
MIRSTFAGFTTAHLAMAASQRALDVTGQNIANINTEGYTRQRLDIASLNTQKGDFYNANSTIKVGYGVEMTGVSQLRDPFLDAQYRSQISKLGTTDAHAAGFEQLATIFDESTMQGVRSAFISLSSSLSTLSTQAGNKENDTAVRSNMQVLLNLFRENSIRLNDIREDMQVGFETTDIKDLNAILENIAQLNTNIKNSQILGNPALELQDQRNLLLDELGSYLPITADYEDQTIGPDQTVEILKVNFTDANGQVHTLVSDGRAGSFDVDIYRQPVTLTLTDTNSTTKQLAGLVKDKDGKDQYVDLLGSGTIKGTLDFLNKSGDFDNSDFKGLGYYQKALDSLVKTFAEMFNEANKEIKKDADGNPIQATDPTTGDPIYKTDENGNFIQKVDKDGKPMVDAAGDPVYEPAYEYEDRPLFEPRDPSKPFSADNIKIAAGWLDGTYGITISNKLINNGTGSTADENILNMVKLLDKSIDFESNGIKFYTGSFHDCFANIENTLGIDAKSANTLLENQIAVLNQTSNSRDGVSGVQLDEEGMNLLHYNQSYNAAARLMTTLDEALDKLINGTGVVGR